MAKNGSALAGNSRGAGIVRKTELADELAKDELVRRRVSFSEKTSWRVTVIQSRVGR